MNENDIKTFKHFLKNHGVNTMFVGMYNEYRYEDNQENIEEYLKSVPRNCVIAYAFDLTMLTNSKFGAKFWDELSQKWVKFINGNDARFVSFLKIAEDFVECVFWHVDLS